MAFFLRRFSSGSFGCLLIFGPIDLISSKRLVVVMSAKGFGGWLLFIGGLEDVEKISCRRILLKDLDKSTTKRNARLPEVS